MVKGLSRRVVMVRFPEEGIFEQAIFMVREDAQGRRGATAESVLREACQIAEGYAPTARKHLFPLVYSLIGGAAVGLVWALSLLIG